MRRSLSQALISLSEPVKRRLAILGGGISITQTEDQLVLVTEDGVYLTLEQPRG
jgi:hypothetical protein